MNIVRNPTLPQAMLFLAFLHLLTMPNRFWTQISCPVDVHFPMTTWVSASAWQEDGFGWEVLLGCEGWPNRTLFSPNR